MKALLFIVLVFVCVLLVLLYACLIAAGRADDYAGEQEMRKRRAKEREVL